jgi:UDP-glucose 4-epimerase
VASWLVTGGAGYIGAHVVRALEEQGEHAVVLDDLSTGERDRVPASADFVHGSVADVELVRRTLRDRDVEGVIHIAAKKQVGESVDEPLTYYRENVTGIQALLDAVVAEDVRSFVFSSSCATYGMPDTGTVDEDADTRPLSPYGTTKLMGEWMCRDVAAATGLRVVALRYFNVAGAATPELGDPGVFNLIPLAFRELDAGERPKLFGNDYPTPDGTCIRDYVHVADIADAHVAALRDLAGSAGKEPFRVFNVGRGEGSSVLEVLGVVGEVTGLDATPLVVERRPGDPARIVGRVDRIGTALGWSARYDLHDMVESAWAGWQLRRSAAPTP